MLLYEVNYFSRLKADSNAFKQMMHTMHHEFGHILHQNVLYPVAFKTISTGYTGNWYNVSDNDARKLGFITSYAQAAPDEDFVEMISMMLTEGKAGFEAILKTISSPTAIARLRQKEAIVVSYFKDVWGINFNSLQTRTRNSIDALIK